MTRSLIEILVGAGLAMSSVPATGQQSEIIQLDPIVVSASRIPSTLTNTLGSVTVIRRDQIEARKPLNAIDLFQSVPGLHIDQPGGRGAVSSVYVRGTDPSSGPQQ